MSLPIVGVDPSSAAWTPPTLDGKLDDTYRLYGTATRYGDTNAHEATGLADYSAAYLYVLEDDNYVYVYYHQDQFYANDNSYGENSIHWESRTNGKRNFFDIYESDMGEFTFKDGGGNVVASFYVDQLAEDAAAPSGYSCGGVGPNSPDTSPYNDGLWLDGDPANEAYFEFWSAMDYNLNSTGYCSGGSCTCGSSGIDLLADSPDASDTYAITDPGCNAWQWLNGWEMRVSKEVFGTLGFGVVIGNHHNSPTKTCEKKSQCPADLYLAYSSIGDRVWHDLDGDGAQDSGEPGISGVTVNLIDPRHGMIIESQITDGSGEYLFEELSHMYYIVQVDEDTLPDDFNSTTLEAGQFHESYPNTVCGSDCIQRDGITYTRVYYIQLNHPEDYTAADFGYKPDSASIGDYVWSDADNDGIQDPGEPGIYGVTVNLLDGSGTPLGPTTTTNYAGWYIFTGLLPGDYKIGVDDGPTSPLAGYTLSLGPESNPNPTDTITIVDEEAYVQADFGYYKAGLGHIGDFVWFDTNNDGFVDPGEDGAGSVTLALHLNMLLDETLDPEDPLIADSITNSSGYYSFDGLVLNQNYLVTVTDSNGILDGFTITTYWGDDPVPSVDPLDLDRYNDPAPITLTDAVPSVDWVDFGYNSPGLIGDTVWFDWNQDGFIDSGEIGVGGVTVTLSGDASDTTTTAADGTYQFTQLESGEYYVEITIPGGYTLSTGTPANPHGPISITGNESYLDADFGLYSDTLYEVGNLVWDDRNGDGDVDAAEEPGFPDVTLELIEDSNNNQVLDPTEPTIGQATSNGSGGYAFYGVTSGNFFVLVTDDLGVLDSYEWTDGEDDTDNNSQVTPYPINVSGDINWADFGYYDPTPTWVNLTSFEAYTQGGQVVVEWETSAEVNTIGFNLYRKNAGSSDYREANTDLLPSLLDGSIGGTYRYIDRGAVPGSSYTYKLVEVDSNGDEHTYGPFDIFIRPGSRGPSMSSTYSRVPNQIDAPGAPATTETYISQENQPEAAPQGQYQIFMPFVTPAHQQIPQVSGTAKLTLQEDGLYYLSAADIASALNIRLWQARELIKDNRLQLANKGASIAYFPDEVHEGIFFLGLGIDSIYTEDNVYWLSDAQGTQIELLGGPRRSSTAAGTFLEVLDSEEEHHQALALFSDPAADFWLWDYFIANDVTHGSKSFTFSSDGTASSGSASLLLRFKGGTDTGANPDHHALIRVNGTQIGEIHWNGTTAHDHTINFDQGLLNDGSNTIEITAILDGGVPYSVFYLDSFQLSYQRHYLAVENSLFASAEGHSVLTIGGFSEPGIMVFEVTNPIAPKLLTSTTIDHASEGFQASFQTASAESRYLALNRSAALTPLSLTTTTPSNLKSSGNQADYLVITTPDLQSSAESLASYRQGQGHTSMVVTVEDIYDEFNHGIPNPDAIRDFLSFAFSNWSLKPKYVLLAGEGTVDYKDNLGYGDNLIPPILVNTSFGLFASDNTLADVVGDDGLADFAIGRIPVSSQPELDAAVSKIIAYESSSGAWQSNIIMLADNPDPGGDFTGDSDDLSALIPPAYNVEKIYLSQQSLGDARQSLIDGINSGAALVNYMGHSGMDRLAQEGLLKTSDVDSLTNGNRLPIITALSCVVARFELPGFDAIGEALFLDQDGGAIAIWAATGLSYNTPAKAATEDFMNAALLGGASILGDGIKQAQDAYAASGNPFSLLDVFTLIGDPALRMKIQ
jgi:hypothetical protein